MEDGDLDPYVTLLDEDEPLAQAGVGKRGFYLRYALLLLVLSASVCLTSEAIGVICATAMVEHPRDWVILVCNIAYGILLLAGIFATHKVEGLRRFVDIAVPGATALVPVTLICVTLSLLSGIAGGAIGADGFAQYIRAVRLGEIQGINASMPSSAALSKGVIGFDPLAYIDASSFHTTVRRVNGQTRTVCVAPVVESSAQREVAIWAVHNDTGTSTGLCCHGRKIDANNTVATCPGWGPGATGSELIVGRLHAHEVEELDPSNIADHVCAKYGRCKAGHTIYVEWLDDKNDDIFEATLWRAVRAYVLTIFLGVVTTVCIIFGLIVHAALHSKGSRIRSAS